MGRLAKAFFYVCACALILTGAGFQEDFAADIISSAGGRELKGRIYCAKDKVRMEMPEGVTITRMDKGVVWVLMTKEKTYLEQAFDPSQAVAARGMVEGESRRILVGKETVDGKQTDKYKVTYSIDGRNETIYQWMAAGLSMPVKTAALDGSWSMEYRNIRPGAQQASLFELPAGYRRFSMRMPSIKDVLKGMGGE